MRRLASLSLDLDNKWSYLKTNGNCAWQEFPSYFDLVVPRILEFLRRHNLKITFFIVGQDAVLDKNRQALSLIVKDGHEIASHSFNHEPWLHLYSEPDIEKELAAAEDAIREATGARVTGFRGPGFSLSKDVLGVLKRRGYRYDASAFPSILNPLARAYFFANSNLSDEEKEQRQGLFGSFSDALRPVGPYRWNLDSGSLIELPVTTMPFFRVPMHFSYLIYLARYSEIIAKAYFRLALAVCAIARVSPSLLLHPLDFLGVDDDSDLAFFPGMQMQLPKKLGIMDDLFIMLTKRFDPVTIGQHINAIEGSADLRHISPKFSIENAG